MHYSISLFVFTGGGGSLYEKVVVTKGIFLPPTFTPDGTDPSFSGLYTSETNAGQRQDLPQFGRCTSATSPFER